jgi:hypothetical protein
MHRQLSLADREEHETKAIDGPPGRSSIPDTTPRVADGAAEEQF